MISSASKHEHMLFKIIEMNRNGLNHDIVSKLSNYLDPDEKYRLIYSNKENSRGLSIIKRYMRISARVPTFIIDQMIQVLFESSKLIKKINVKLENSSNDGVNEMVGIVDFNTALRFYNSEEKQNLRVLVEDFFNYFDLNYHFSIRYHLINGYYNIFRDPKFTEFIISPIRLMLYEQSKNITMKDAEFKRKFKIFIVSFLFLLSCKESYPFLNSIVMKKVNYGEVFAVVKSFLSFIDINEMERFFTNKCHFHRSDESALQICFQSGSIQLQKEFLKCLKSVFVDKTAFQKYLIDELCSYGAYSTFESDQNIFHVLFSKQFINFEVVTLTYELFISEFENRMEVTKKLLSQQNRYGETPLMSAVKHTNFKDCLNFFSSILNDTSEFKTLLNDSGRGKRLVINRIFASTESFDNFNKMIEIVNEVFGATEKDQCLLNILCDRDDFGRNFFHYFFFS